MVKKVFALSVFFICEVINGRANPYQIFKQANELYAKGRYQEACDEYLKIEKEGLSSFELYYNLGNAYYRLNQIGKSVLYFEKAKKLNPTDPDLQQNLKLAYLRTTDRIEPQEILFFEKLGLNLINLFSPNAWAYITVCVLFFTTLFFVLQKFLSQFRFVLVVGGVVGIVLFVTTFFLSWRSKVLQQSQNTAVIMSPSVNSYSEPNSNASLLFTLHEGTLVKIKEEEGEWCRIELPTGVSGWVPQIALSKI